MRSFKKESEHKIEGRGRIVVVNRHDYPEIALVRTGDVVEIDGERLEVRAVEGYQKLIYPPILGDNFGLVVKPVEKGR